MKSSMKWLQEQEKKALKKVDDSTRSVVGQEGSDGSGGLTGGSGLVSLAALRGSLNARGGNMFSPARGGLLRPPSSSAVPQRAMSSVARFSSPSGMGSSSSAFVRALSEGASIAATAGAAPETAAAAPVVPLGSSARKTLTIKPRAPRPPSGTLRSLSSPEARQPPTPFSPAAPGAATAPELRRPSPAPLTPPPEPDAGGGVAPRPLEGHPESAGGAPALRQTSAAKKKVSPGAPVLTKAHYECSPPLSELQTLPASDLRAVEGFVVEKYDPKTSERVGSIAWLDPVNLESANLDEDVTIVNCHSEPKGHFSVAVYEHFDRGLAPKAGVGLNQRAEITFWGVHCKSSNPDKIAAYPEKLRDMVSSIGGTFVSYKDGVLKYRVSDFDAE